MDDADADTTVEELLDELLAPGCQALAGTPEEQRPAALAAGLVPGIPVPVGIYVNALVSITHRDWLDALFGLREALNEGLEPALGRFAFEKILCGLDEDLSGAEALRADLFKPSSLALLRITEVELNHPGMPLVGPEVEIVFTENRSLKELQVVFLELLGPQAFRSEADMEKLVIGLQHRVTAPKVPENHRAEALARLAAVAVQANDFKSACEYVRRAFNLDPQNPEVLIAAEFTWLLLNAAARDGVLTDAACLPTAMDLHTTLKAVLTYEALHPAGTPEQIAARNQKVEEMFP